MLMHTSAAAESIGQGKAHTSRYKGGRTFGSVSTETHARIDRRQSASRSLGCQIRFGIARANCTTCCPVPLPTSRTTPLLGSSWASTSLIGPLLRSADGLDRRSLGKTASSSDRTMGSHVDPNLAAKFVTDCAVPG